QRAYIKIETIHGTTVPEIHAALNEVCGTDTVDQIRKKRPGMLQNGVSILHDNARPHIGAPVIALLEKYGWERLKHPPYSPDLSPPDFDLFPKLKEPLRGIRFPNLDILNEEVFYSPIGTKRKNIETAVKVKKIRMGLVNAPGITEIDSSHSRKIVWYYTKNLNNIFNYKIFLQSLKPSIIQLLKTISVNNPIKFNFKLESIYYKPQVDNSTVDRSFKTSARAIFFESEIEDIVEENIRTGHVSKSGKGVYLYVYTDSWGKLEEETLRDEFFSTLMDENIAGTEYNHAKAVWRKFGCKTFGEYSDLYLKIDVMLLTDVFDNFRDICQTTYNLDPAYYYTAPGFSFDCMLKYTGVKLELPSDYDMLLMFENGIRGGLVQASKRYGKANNYTTPDYDKTKDDSCLIYQDCDVRVYAKRRIRYEVDIEFPKHSHDDHNDLPFLPNNGVPPGSKVRMLKATLEEKTNYIIHYRNLRQAMANGLIVKKSPWLKKYIVLNTEMRKKAANTFEKDFYKFVNKAVFDSLVYHIDTRNFYEDLLKKLGFLDCTDTSNLPANYPCFVTKRKNITGLFSDESDGKTITEFCALRAKSYAYKIDGVDKIMAKGIRGHVVKNHMTFDDHIKCLFDEDGPDVYRENVSIRS
ncbi:Ribonuclease H-like domain, partial [Cinara cedri]